MALTSKQDEIFETICNKHKHCDSCPIRKESRKLNILCYTWAQMFPNEFDKVVKQDA
ncbi:hypothetical protein [uncultured Duncaniella sp.]|uniref:hypothetical protein n=1 Tax=uncultured Duncaniella sp. TaxID=2768039 RepID=UPI0026145249|nr:hypothetical protein [uncultured Duncaniella sp.]